MHLHMRYQQACHVRRPHAHTHTLTTQPPQVLSTRKFALCCLVASAETIVCVGAALSGVPKPAYKTIQARLFGRLCPPVSALALICGVAGLCPQAKPRHMLRSGPLWLLVCIWLLSGCSLAARGCIGRLPMQMRKKKTCHARRLHTNT